MRLFARKPTGAKVASSSDSHPPRRQLVRNANALAPRFDYDLTSVPVYGSRDAAIRRKLLDDRAGDAFEHDADRRAQEVVHGPAHGIPMARPAATDGSVDRQRITSKVSDALDTPGQSLDRTTRAFMEPRFGSTFDDVRIHTGDRASRAAADVHARAFTAKNHIVFGHGEYAPHTDSGRSLLAHELTHVLQQQAGIATAPLQRTPCIDERAPGPFNVAVIGAPGPGEIQASHPYQFMNAARYAGVTRNTVWIVEQTGYVAGNIDRGQIESNAAPGCLLWLTPQRPLASILASEFPEGSIGSMTVYSHGLPGQVTLRYGWESQGLPNYGITLPQVRSFSDSRFTPDATINFDSCNTGTDVGEGALAQEMAYTTGRQVRAWTGRTSYAEVNDGGADNDTAVHGSEVWREGRRQPDWTEVASRFLLRTPQLMTFSPPGRRVGGFSSNFTIMASVQSRHFDVPAGGTVVVRCSNANYLGPNRPPNETDRIGIFLERSADWAIDPRVGHESLRADIPDIAIFSNLDAGEYYLEIKVESLPDVSIQRLTGDIAVDIHAGRS